MKKVRGGAADVAFTWANTALLVALCLITIYPLLHVVNASVSEPEQLFRYRGVMLRPLGFTLEGYKLTLENPMIRIGFLNTIYLVVVGTTLNVLITSMGAFVLSRKYFKPRTVILFYVSFTMFFSGGIIPTYLVVRGLGLLNTRWSLILSVLVRAWNLLIMKTYLEGMPESLEESAKMDGAAEPRILFQIILPLAMPVVAVMVLFYSVDHWNAFFRALMYLRNRNLYPLQLVLREILITNSVEAMAGQASGDDASRMLIGEVLRYAAIVVATVPILAVYPFIQRYFVKGVMIGAIKG
jgi:putative aldouronate transport system permease protein